MRMIIVLIKFLLGVIKNKFGIFYFFYFKNEIGFCMFESDNKYSLFIELYIYVIICL